MKNRISIFLISLFTLAIIPACGEDEALEDFFLGSFSGMISCTLIIDNMTTPIDDLPYSLTISRGDEGDGNIALTDGFILFAFSTPITSSSTYEGSNSRFFAELDIDGNILENVNLELSTDGVLINDQLTHNMTITGTSNQGDFSFTCASSLSR